MDREIKFRAWDKQNGMMVAASTKLMAPINTTTPVSETAQQNGYELMQYTGLKDKNGTEIYEGDVIYAHINKARYEVKHGLYINTQIDSDGKSPDCFGWYLERNGDDCDYGEGLHGAKEFLKVIGNIHENPELLEVKS